MSQFPKICEHCKVVFLEHEQFIICPHDWRKVVRDRQDQGINGLFHKLWTKDVGTSGYNKNDWMELQRLLQARGIDI